MKREQTRVSEERSHKSGSGFLGHLRGYMLTGLLVALPIWVTGYFAWLILDWADRTIAPLIPASYNPNTYLPFAIPGLGLVVILWSLVVIGWLAASLFGRFLVRTGEGIVARMPFIRGVYSASKQIVESILAQQSDTFREVVLIEFPRTDCWSLGFVTGKTEGEIQEVTEDEVLNIYVPTTPNPTSGYLVFLPRSETVKLSMSVEDGIKLVVSGGIVSPPDRRPLDQRRGKVVPAARRHIEAAGD